MDCIPLIEVFFGLFGQFRVFEQEKGKKAEIFNRRGKGNGRGSGKKFNRRKRRERRRKDLKSKEKEGRREND
jgi:hypothetical protein